MIKLSLFSMEFKTPLNENKTLSITVQHIKDRQTFTIQKQFPNHQKKSTQPFDYDARKNLGLINEVLKCEDIIINHQEEPAIIEINEEEGDDIRMPKKRKLIGKQLIKISNVKQSVYQINLNSNQAKVKYSCEFGSSKTSSSTLIQPNNSKLYLGIHLITIQNALLKDIQIKKFISEDDDFTSDQNDILSINRNLGSIVHDRKNLIQIEKKNLNQIDDEYFFEESMVENSRRDQSNFRVNTSISTDNGANNLINGVLIQPPSKNSSQLHQQTRFNQTIPLSPISSSRDQQQDYTNLYAMPENSYQYVAQKEQFIENSNKFINHAKIIIQTINFLKSTYSWSSSIQSLGYGVGVTLLLTYFNMTLILCFVALYKFPHILQEYLFYPNDQCSDEDLYCWNKVCQEFVEFISECKEKLNPKYKKDTLFTILVYLLLVTIMNSIFGLQKVFILLFWIHLFSHNYNGWKFCKVFHYEIFGPLIEQAYQFISMYSEPEDNIPDENVEQDIHKVYQPIVHMKQDTIQEFEIFENQRLSNGKNWQPQTEPLERSSWSNEDGSQSLSKIGIKLPNTSWIWIDNDWQIDVNQFTDNQGWEYAQNFNDGVYSNLQKQETQVRRRRWVRRAIYRTQTLP